MNSIMLLRLKELKAVLRNEKGQGMVEYGLIMALVAVLCIAGLSDLSDGILGMLDTVTSGLAHGLAPAQNK